MNGGFTEYNWNVTARLTVQVTIQHRAKIMTDQDKSSPPEPVLSGEPEEGLEHAVRKHPDDADAKVDLGSDESMDASDPSAAAQPGCSDEPVPSSGFPE
jgi:hypothetical protein